MLSAHTRGRTVASSARPDSEAQAGGVDRACRLGNDAKPRGTHGVETAIQHPVCNCAPKHASRAAATQHACDGEEHTWNMVATLAVFQLATFWLKADAA